MSLSGAPVVSPVGKIYTAPPPARGALEPLFLPRSVAVIGATDRPGTVGRSVVSNLLESKFPLKIYPVNPSHPEVAGIKTQKRIADIPGGVDLALVVTPAQTVPQIIGECVDAGVKSAVVISAGFREQGPDGALLEEDIKKHLQRGSLRLIGPNCPGVLSPGKANVGIIPAQFFEQGSIGVVSKSGTLTYQIGNELKQAGLGNSTIVGIGGDPIVGSDFIDILTLFEEDEETELIVMVGEIGGDAEERAAEFIAEKVSKPVVAYIAGFTAPPGKQMGHAGAIISGSSGTAEAKKQALEAQGIRVGKSPTETAQLAAETIGAKA